MKPSLQGKKFTQCFYKNCSALVYYVAIAKVSFYNSGKAFTPLSFILLHNVGLLEATI